RVSSRSRVPCPAWAVRCSCPSLWWAGGGAVRGWLAFTTAVCLEWLRGSDLAREQVRDLCARALLGVLTVSRN
ncbi:hypothetical protein ABT317_47380, partial [Streptomyces carpinensis]